MEPSELAIDAASRDDIALVVRLADTIWRAYYPAILSGAQIDYMLARGYAPAVLAKLVRDAGAGLAIARERGDAVGFAAWHRADEPATAKLDKLYVLPARHGHGVGRALIGHVEAAARRDGAGTLILNVNKRNAGAIAAYRACGFAIREAVVIDIGGGFVMDDFVMAKAL